MKRFLLILVCIFAFASHFRAYAVADTVKVGLFTSDLYDLNSAEGTFSAEIRYWILHTADSARTSYTEFPHSKNFKFTGFRRETRNGVTWIQTHVSAQFLHNWDMSNFPFDRQRLRIINECTLDTSKVVLKADAEGSQIKDDALGSGFKVVHYRVYDTLKVNNSDFGNPFKEVDNMSFSRIVTEIDIVRSGTWVIFFKIFAAVVISFYISTLVFFIKPQHFEARFSLPVGALFAAVGSKFVVDSLLGITSTITLVDKIYIFTYIMIFVIAVLSLVSYKVYENADPQTIVHIHNRKFDLWSMISTCVLYCIVLVAMIVVAAGSVDVA